MLQYLLCALVTTIPLSPPHHSNAHLSTRFDFQIYLQDLATKQTVKCQDAINTLAIQALSKEHLVQNLQANVETSCTPYKFRKLFTTWSPMFLSIIIPPAQNYTATDVSELIRSSLHTYTIDSISVTETKLEIPPPEYSSAFALTFDMLWWFGFTCFIFGLMIMLFDDFT